MRRLTLIQAVPALLILLVGAVALAAIDRMARFSERESAVFAGSCLLLGIVLHVLLN